MSKISKDRGIGKPSPGIYTGAEKFGLAGRPDGFQFSGCISVSVIYNRGC